MAHDRDYFHRRAAEARSAAFKKDGGEGVEVAGHLALAYAALARRNAAAAAAAAVVEIEVVEAPPGNDVPLMFRD